MLVTVTLCDPVWEVTLAFGHSCFCSANIFAYFYVFSVSWSLCRLSHLCFFLKPCDGFKCHLAGTLAGSNNTLHILDGGFWPQKRCTFRLEF